MSYQFGDILFAPMEGITEQAYRLAISHAFSGWNKMATDFLRISQSSHYSKEKILKHFGEKIFSNSISKKNTVLQILAGPGPCLEKTLEYINELQINHLDLNLGCPSNTVNSHKGGAYFLKHLDELTVLLSSIRKLFPNYFSVKIRIGYHDDKNFLTLLKIIEDHGVNAVTIHARTRDQGYNGFADWDYIKTAVEILKIPVIGNGDIWKIQDIENMFKKTGCFGVMLGRGALKSPWLADDYKNKKDSNLLERKNLLDLYFYTLMGEYRIAKFPDEAILKRFKALSRYCFDDYPNYEILRSQFLRSNSLNEFFSHLENLIIDL